MKDVKKGFFEKPEGKFGAVLGLAILGGLGFLLWFLLPVLIILAQQTIYLGLMVGFIILVAFLIVDEGSRNICWGLYKLICKKLTGMIIEMNPIAIVKGYIDDLKKKYRQLQEQMQKISGELKKLETAISNNEKEVANLVRKGKAAQKEGKDGIVASAARQITMLNDQTARYKGTLSKIGMLTEILKKMYSNTGIMIETLEFDVDMQEKEFKMMSSVNKGMKSVMSMLAKDGKRAMFDQAMEYMVDQTAFKLGEIESMIDQTEDFMANIDFNNGMMEQEGLDFINSIDAKTNKLFEM